MCVCGGGGGVLGPQRLHLTHTVRDILPDFNGLHRIAWLDTMVTLTVSQPSCLQRAESHRSKTCNLTEVRLQTHCDHSDTNFIRAYISTCVQRNGTRQNSTGQNGPGLNGTRQNSTGQNGPGLNGTRQNSTGQNGPGLNGTRQNSTGQNGPGLNGTRQNSTGQNGPGLNGTRQNSTGQNGPGLNGTRQNSTGQNGPGLNGTRQNSTRQNDPLLFLKTNTVKNEPVGVRSIIPRNNLGGGGAGRCYSSLFHQITDYESFFHHFYFRQITYFYQRIASILHPIANCDILISNEGFDILISNSDIILSNCDIMLSNGDILLSNCDIMMSNSDILLPNCDIYYICDILIPSI